MRIRRSFLVGVSLSVLIGIGLSFSPVDEVASDALDKVTVSADETAKDGRRDSGVYIRGVEGKDIDHSMSGVVTLLGLFAGAIALITLVVKVSMRF